jgi:hypothetical protein
MYVIDNQQNLAGGILWHQSVFTLLTIVFFYALSEKL